MPYSYIMDMTSEDSGAVTEPVTLAEAKTYIRVSGSSEDDLITAMITRARQSIERATGLAIVDKDVTVWFSNENGSLQIPVGPYQSDFKLYNNETDDEILAADYTLIGGQFPVLKRPELSNLRMEYVAGYATVPEALKGAILDQVNYIYENRGANIDSLGFAPKVATTVLQWTRQSPIL